MLKAVLFDVDGVLMDSRAANDAFYKELMQRHGYPEPAEPTLARAHYLTLFEAIDLLTADPDKARVQAIWEGAKSLSGYRSDLLRLPGDCECVLGRLGRQYHLGVVTGRIRLGLDQFFAYSDLESYFEVAITVEDYARPKPAPEPLLVACERLGIAPSEALYVGDAPLDRRCALDAGCAFVAYGGGIPESEHAVDSFAALEELLGTLAHA